MNDPTLVVEAGSMADVVSKAFVNDVPIGEVKSVEMMPGDALKSGKLGPTVASKWGKPHLEKARLTCFIRPHFKNVVVPGCEHQIQPAAIPRNNCGVCWNFWLEKQPRVVSTAYEVVKRFGKDQLVKAFGKKFAKYYKKFTETHNIVVEEPALIVPSKEVHSVQTEQAPVTQ
jgi:hypothetical protein